MPPQYLSENSFIFSIGLATPVYHHAMGWFEAGESVRYLGRTADIGFMTPDYRGGLAYNRGWGRALGSESRGWFADTSNDGLYVSRFQARICCCIHRTAPDYLLPGVRQCADFLELEHNLRLEGIFVGELLRDWARGALAHSMPCRSPCSSRFKQCAAHS